MLLNQVLTPTTNDDYAALTADGLYYRKCLMFNRIALLGVVLGLVGTNGIGKSTALKVLAGKQKPNLGRFNDPPGLDRFIFWQIGI